MLSEKKDQRPVTKVTLRRIGTFAKGRRGQLALFLVLSVVTAATAVATPVLAGRVVDAIVNGESEGVVIRLAALIAGIALAEAAISILTRWLSSTIGEGLILDLRTAVFDHVLRMPIAFFHAQRRVDEVTV
jgi:ABC-type bacteriocin/lantibiotic exporter with double-glycine peptidase domain